MSKWIKYWVPGMSILAAIASLVAIGYSCYRVEPVTFSIDRHSLMIDVLSILTTVLIGWQIFNYFSFEGKMKKLINKKVEKAKKEIKKDYIRGLTTTNLLLIPQYASLNNNRFIFVILATTYKGLLKIEDYESADDVSMSILEYFSFDCTEVDVDNVKNLIPLLEKISPHSNQTELLLSKLKDKCGLSNS